MLIELFGGQSELDDKKYYFFGGLYPIEKYNDIFYKSKKGFQSAANSFQWSLIEGMEYNLKRPVNIINLMFIGSFPKKFHEITIKKYNFKHSDNSNDVNLGFLNLSILKELSRMYSVNKFLKHNKDLFSNNSILFMYSVQSIWLSVAKRIKGKNKNTHICFIVPDLPQFTSMEFDKNIFFRLYKLFLMKKTSKHMKYIDSYVYLTENMRHHFDPLKPYVVVEGLINSSNMNQTNNIIKNDDIHKVILYTGTLTKKYGILELINAFHMIDKSDYRLIICGDGETKFDILKACALDKRIQYLGLKKHEEIIRLQKEATVLINPRKNNSLYTKYSFPSKTIEYMSSGTPVISYKLEGIPDEYDKYIYYVEGSSTEKLRDKIVEVCEKSNQERKAFGLDAQKFIYKHKNSYVQTKKIIDMIQSNINNK